MSPDGLFCWCRPGFEPDLAAELGERAAAAGVGGYARAERDSGFVEFLGARHGAQKNVRSRNVKWGFETNFLREAIGEG